MTGRVNVMLDVPTAERLDELAERYGVARGTSPAKLSAPDCAPFTNGCAAPHARQHASSTPRNVRRRRAGERQPARVAAAVAAAVGADPAAVRVALDKALADKKRGDLNGH